MKNAPDRLDFFTLIAEFKKLDASRCQRVVRLAVLADFATQHLVQLLCVLFARHGVWAEIYAAEYDTIDAEILDPQSGLYAFNPDCAVLLSATPKLRTKFYECPDRTTFVAHTVDRVTGRWAAFRRHSAVPLVQGTYVLPLERAFGHYEMKVPLSLGAVVADINRGIVEAARNTGAILLCDVDFIAASVGRRHWFDPRLWYMAKGICALDHLPELAAALEAIIHSALGRFTKCLVLDLDNTLWGGVIGDDGINGIALGGFDEGEAFVDWQYFIAELKRRGVILTVVSKNDHHNAVLPFTDHPDMVLKETDISVFLANWDNKADNIRVAQKVLNIGFDSMVFLDDNPFERGVVRQFVPDVVVPDLPEDPSSYLHAIAGLNLFETASHSEADAQRADQYRDEARRELDKSAFANMDDYLKSLDMQISLHRFNGFNLPRIAQLIQRSNQFNLTTKRYGEAACLAFAQDPQWVPFAVSLADRYGDYGLISVVILKPSGPDLQIDLYLMSCRVLKRGVESYVMNRIFDYARAHGFDRVVGTYVPTAKNAMVKTFFADFGFQNDGESADGDVAWFLSVSAYTPQAAFISPVIDELT